MLRYDELDVVVMAEDVFEEKELELDEGEEDAVRLVEDVTATARDAIDKVGDADEDFCNGAVADDISDGDNGAIDSND